MRKKLIILALATACVTAATGCAKKDAVTPVETTVEASTETEAVDNTDITDPNKDETVEAEDIPTYGYYATYEEGNDANGIYYKAVFVDMDGNEFEAVLPEDITIDDLEVGAMYSVTHSEVMTMSIPPIYPEVYSITKLDEVEQADMEAAHETDSASESVAEQKPVVDIDINSATDGTMTIEGQESIAAGADKEVVTETETTSNK